MNKLLSKKTVQYIAVALAIGLALYNANEESPTGSSTNPSTDTYQETQQAQPDNKQVNLAYEQQQSDVQVTGSGVVVRVLRDDNEGSRHQKMILKIPSGLRLLIAHNIDLAPRIDNIREGDTVDFYGEYEWNKKGGVIHWTHHDPGGRHEHGWLKHQGKTYQ